MNPHVSTNDCYLCLGKTASYYESYPLQGFSAEHALGGYLQGMVFMDLIPDNVFPLIFHEISIDYY